MPIIHAQQQSFNKLNEPFFLWIYILSMNFDETLKFIFETSSLLLSIMQHAARLNSKWNSTEKNKKKKIRFQPGKMERTPDTSWNFIRFCSAQRSPANWLDENRQIIIYFYCRLATNAIQQYNEQQANYFLLSKRTT